MTSAHCHSRTQSAVPSLNASGSHLSSAGHVHQRHISTGSGNVQASFNEHQSWDDYSVRLVDLARNSCEDLQLATQISAPPRVASPSRPALGARLLSSLSNTQPTAAALSRKGSVLHSRAKSLAAFVPNLNISPASSPERPQSTTSRTSRASRTIGDLFHGESAPVRLGPPVSPTKEKDEDELIMDYKSIFTERPTLLRRQQTAPLAVPKAPSKPASIPKAAPSTSWFSRKPTNPIPPKQPQDELATLNINSALFPNGPADSLDPTAFNNLLLNATNLLHRMQTAYREKVEYIASIRPEQEAQQDEVEGAETRAVHLKKQLEDMSRRAQEQETTMKEMAAELAEERMKTLEAQEALANATANASSTIRLVTNDNLTANGGLQQRRTKKRGSTSAGSDSGFESDMESIFSSYSSNNPPIPPDTPLTPPCMSRMPSFESRLNINVQQANALHDPSKPVAVSNATTPTAAEGNGGRSGQRLGREGAAWATVDALRSENRELKRYVQEMQESLQGCIEFVSTIGDS